MDDVTRELWVLSARATLEGMLCGLHPDRTSHVPSVTCNVHKVIDVVVEVIAHGVGEWSPAVARAVDKAVHRFWLNRFVMGHDVGSSQRELGLHVAAVRMAHALAVGDASCLDGDERSLACDRTEAVLRGRPGGPVANLARDRVALLRRSPAGRTRPSPAPPSPADAVAFAHLWTRRVGSSDVGTVSTAFCPLRHLTSEEAPVACRLVTPDGGQLEVRVHDGVPMRPVLAPSSWRPCGLDAFRRAAADGVAWADNPFAPVDRVVPLSGLSEDAAPEPTRLGRRDAEWREVAVAGLLGNIRELLVIDGVVHRACPVPVVHVVSDGHRAWRAAWTVPGQVSSLDDVTRLRLCDRRVRHLAPRNGDFLSDATRDDPVSFACLPVDAMDDLHVLAEACVPADLPLGTLTIPCELVRPELLPRDPARARRSLADLLEDRLIGTAIVPRTILGACARAARDVRADAGFSPCDTIPDVVRNSVRSRAPWRAALFDALEGMARAEADLERDLPDLVDLVM